jgi:hypothetical protein
MLTGTSGISTRKSRTSAATLGLLLCAWAHTAAASASDSVDALPGGASLYGYVREARDAGVSAPARWSDNCGGLPAELSAPVDVSLSDLLARLHYACGSGSGLSSDGPRQVERQALVRNSDALVGATVRRPLREQWLVFVYADLGAADSALRWQGLAGIHAGMGVDLLGGWRHVTYRFSPGAGFDSMEFNGPFIGATLAW